MINCSKNPWNNSNITKCGENNQPESILSKNQENEYKNKMSTDISVQSHCDQNIINENADTINSITDTNVINDTQYNQSLEFDSKKSKQNFKSAFENKWNIPKPDINKTLNSHLPSLEDLKNEKKKYKIKKEN